MEPIDNPRILSIDVFRGFALAGIVIVHFVEQFLGGPIPESQTSIMLQGIPDYVVVGILQIFLTGKFFALFSILFGLSFYIQMRNAEAKSKNYRWRFIWRLIILMVFGLFHSMFYRGDILTIYALIGVLLPFLDKISNKILLLIASILFLGLGRFMVFSVNGSAGFFGLIDFEQNSESSMVYFQILTEGSIWQVFKDNLTNGLLMKFEYQFGIFNRGYLTLGFFLIGIWLGRIQLFQNLEKWRGKIKNFMWYSLAFSLVCLVLVGVQFARIPQPIDFEQWSVMVAMHTMDLANIGLTGFIFALFIVIYNSKRGKRLAVLAPYGRTALTNYITQSLIGTFIFYGWGLGYLAQVRNIYTFAFAFIVIIIQVLISKWWMKQFYFGPLEWIWRCLTWWELKPFRRKKEH